MVTLLQLMACIKSGRVTNSRFDQLAQEAQKDVEEEEAKRKTISVDRSGGGVWVYTFYSQVVALILSFDTTSIAHYFILPSHFALSD